MARPLCCRTLPGPVLFWRWHFRPNAPGNQVVAKDGVIRVMVTVVPEEGKATAAAMVLLARVLGVAKSRLEMVCRATLRDKLFRLG